MKLESKFNCGDLVYCIVDGSIVKVLTVGEISVKFIDSPGIPGKTLFVNYKPQKSYEETYMCVETGIGSGYVFTLGKHLFATYKEAAQALQNYKQSVLQKGDKANGPL